MAKSKKAKKAKKPLSKKQEIRGNDKLNKAIVSVRKFCLRAIVVLLYVLAVVAALHQSLILYAMSRNVETSKQADTIIEDVYGRGAEVLQGVEHIELKAPKGTGNYVALFGEDEVWLVSEMSVKESLSAIALFVAIDLATYCITIWLVKKSKIRSRVGTLLLCCYQQLFIAVAWVVHAQALSVLFDLSWVAHVYTLLRSVVFVVLVWCVDSDKHSEDSPLFLKKK